MGALAVFFGDALFRDALYRAITTPRGDGVAALRIPKDLARRINATLGEPLAAKEELERRAEARRRLKELREAPARAGSSESRSGVRSEDAPVLVYFEKDRNVRLLTRIEELLTAKSLAWRRLDVAGDEATIDFVTRRAACERDDLPVVFVGDRVIGGYEALVAADVSGELESIVRTVPVRS
jgi:hypothetical protein